MVNGNASSIAFSTGTRNRSLIFSTAQLRWNCVISSTALTRYTSLLPSMYAGLPYILWSWKYRVIQLMIAS
jgi:hypothetical protein